MKRKARLFNIVPVWLVVAVVVLVAGAAMCQAQDNQTTEEAKTPKMTFLELLERGGLQFMIPIGLCSLLGVTIIIERLFALRKSAVMPRGFLPGLKGVFQQDQSDCQAGLDYCNANGSPLSRVVAAGIRKLHKSEDAVERAIEDAGALEVDRLRRNMHLLFLCGDMVRVVVNASICLSIAIRAHRSSRTRKQTSHLPEPSPRWASGSTCSIHAPLSYSPTMSSISFSRQ